MLRTISLLQRVEIASPCPAKWEEMDGDDRKRFCHQCQKHVYNFAAMSEPEAEQLLIETEGKLCGRIFRRADGTILTADCPVGVARVRRAFRRTLAVCAGVVVTVLSGMGVAARAMSGAGNNSSMANSQPMKTLIKWAQNPAPVMTGIAGDIMVMPAPPPATPAGNPAPAPNNPAPVPTIGEAAPTE